VRMCLFFGMMGGGGGGGGGGHDYKTGDIWHICIEVVLLLGCYKCYLPLVVFG
jgi:hypothetical protein